MSYRNRQRSDGSQKQLISDGGYSTFDSGSYQRDDLLGAPKQSSTDDNTMSSEEQAPPPQPQATFQEYPRHVIMRIPNTAFGISMGLAGNAILWKSVGKSAIFNAANANTEALHGILWLLALLVAAWVFTCYCYKCYYHYELVVREWQHPVRVHFMNAPHLIMLMLAIGLPDRFNASEMALQIVFGLGLVFQTLITQFVYEKWLFNPNSNITSAKPPFLLSTVGWFLLANFGIGTNIEATWGLAIPQFCFGIGAVFYLLVAIAVMNGLHSSTKPMKGSPSLTLLLAPPSVGIVALDTFDGDPTKFNNAAAMVLGWILVLFMLFARIGPAFVREPCVLGEYWAYVFPLAAVATAWIRYASVVNTTAATIVAAAFMSVAIVALVSVLARMTIHCFQCFRGQAQWGDPLLGVPSQSSRPEPTATRPQRSQDSVI